jgi:hypothetical protein
MTTYPSVIPAKAGIQFFFPAARQTSKLDSRPRGYDQIFDVVN